MSFQGDKPPPEGDVLILFDVDETLTPSRQSIDDNMSSYLQELRTRVKVGLVGGSDLKKIAEQMCNPQDKLSGDEAIKYCTEKFDYVFAENGLVAYRNGEPIGKQSLLDHLGEAKTQKFINFCLGYMSQLELPAKRGNFIEFRNGLINVCPVGRSCSQHEREQFNSFDKDLKIREKFIQALEERFGPTSDDPLGLVYSIGGQISFDAFPEGWDKRFCLGLIQERYKHIHFFGDKTNPGGNDHEIYADPRTIGHSVTGPSDTLRQLIELGL